MKIASVLLLSVSMALLGGCASTTTADHALSGTKVSAVPTVSTLKAKLPEGTISYDLYMPAGSQPAPLVVVAHGFTRHKENMVGYGQRLSAEGFVVAIPQLPSLTDNWENAHVMNHLIEYLGKNIPESPRIDTNRTGVTGISAGGLTSLLAACDNPQIKAWVGLDPVDHMGMGQAAAPRYHGASTVLRAPPTAWNGHGNALKIEAVLPNGAKDILIPDSVHIDAEIPTDILAELAIGFSKEPARQQFAEYCVQAFKETLKPVSQSSLTASPAAKPAAQVP